MSKRRWLTVGAAGLACLMAACDQAAPLPTASASHHPLQQRHGGVTDQWRSVVRLFAIDAHVSGQIRTGSPVTIDVHVRAALPTTDATVTVTLPDLELARQHNWTTGAVVMDQRIPSTAQYRQTFAGSATAAFHPVITIPKPGYYRVVIRASADAKNVGGRAAGQGVQTVSVREMWLLVTQSGGRVTSTFDRSLLPEGVDDARLGQFQPKVRPAAVHPDFCVCDSPCTPQPPGCGSQQSQLNINVMYYNPDYNAYKPFGEANYKVTLVSNGAVVQTGTAGSSGAFSVPCPGPTGAYKVTLYDRSTGKINVLDPVNGGTQVAGVYQTAVNPCGSTFNLTIQLADDPFNWIYDNMRLAVDSSRSFFQRSRGELGVNYAWRDSIHVSFYADDPDQVTITELTLGGDYGRFTTAHEYGHALAAVALGGDRTGGCPSQHAIDGYYTLLCAISEGWADYHSVAARGAADSSYYTGIELNSFYFGGDGSIDEGAVAAFLFDFTARPGITDVYNGFDLALHYPGSYAADLMKTCSVQGQSPFPRQAIGIDDFIQCAMRLHSRSVDAPYFTTQNDPPTDESDNATLPSNWNAANIARVYRHKLFGL